MPFPLTADWRVVNRNIVDVQRSFQLYRQGVEEASGKVIKYVVVARRPGDVAACYAGMSKEITSIPFA